MREKPMSVKSEDSASSIAPATRTKAFDPESDTAVEGATLYVGTGGDVVVDAQRDEDGTKTTFVNVPDGYLLPVRVKKVYGAGDGTTAADLVLIW
jgi:hypothetical protein